MRKLAVTESITLDGVIDASEGWFVPSPREEEVDQSDLNAALRVQTAAADAVLLGRVTFEEMRGFWPLRTGDQTGITDYLNNVEKYVVLSTMTEPGWQHSTVLGHRARALQHERLSRRMPDLSLLASTECFVAR
jgi:dihydrofolate reductase